MRTSRQEVDPAATAGVVVADRRDVLEDARQADEVVGLVAHAASGEAGRRVFQVVEGVGPAIEGLDDPVGFRAQAAGDDVFAAFGRGRGKQFVVQQEGPVRADAQLGPVGELQFDDGAGLGDDLLAFTHGITRLDGGELAAGVTQVGFALDEDYGALGNGVGGGRRGGGGHGVLRKSAFQMEPTLRADDQPSYCPRGQGA